MPSHFPVFVKSNNKNMGFKDMADVDFYVGFSKRNSNHIGNVRVTQEVLDKDTRKFRLYLNDELISTKHIER